MILNLLKEIESKTFENFLITFKNASIVQNLVETYFFFRNSSKITENELNDVLNDLKNELYDTLKNNLYTLPKSIIIRLEVGQGGLDAQDWTNILFHSYLNFFKINKISYKILTVNQDNRAGITAASIVIDDPSAQLFFKYEEGSHRLERVSPFNAKKKVQTSNSLVKILPNLKADNRLFNEKDIVIKRTRSGGPGGQFTNKVETAIVLKHIPTGIVIKSSSSKSQHQNLQNALTLLRAELYRREQEKIDQIQRDLHVKSNKSVIRTYDLTLHTIKDHRNNFKMHQPEKFFKGNIFSFLLNNLGLYLQRSKI